MFPVLMHYSHHAHPFIHMLRNLVKVGNVSANLKEEKSAARYLYHKSPAIWDDLAKMGGSGNPPSSSVNGVSNSKSIADLFTEYYSDIYNSVSFDEEEMQWLYGDVCECVKCINFIYLDVVSLLCSS